MDESSSQPLLYQALGIVTGRLQYIPGLPCSLLFEDGRRLRISDLKGKVKAWLENCPEVLETPRSWGIYPRTDRDGVLTHAGLHAWRNQICPTRFKIVGDLAYQAPGTVTMRICRNVPPPEGKERHLAWKPFFLTLRGELPNANLREGWQMHGEIEGEQIRITVAEKLKDAPSSRKRQPGFKKPQRVAPQTDADVSQRGDLAAGREEAEPTPLKPEPREPPDWLQSQPILEPMTTMDSISPSTAPEANPDSSQPTAPSAPQKAQG